MEHTNQGTNINKLIIRKIANGNIALKFFNKKSNNNLPVIFCKLDI